MENKKVTKIEGDAKIIMQEENSLRIGDIALQSSTVGMQQLVTTLLSLLKEKEVKKYLKIYKLNRLCEENGYIE